MSREDELVQNLEGIQARINAACEAAGRDPSEVTLVAVSKTKPVADIQALYDAGHRDFGENYVQEWQDKAEFLPNDIRWHFIGVLQSNKCKYLAGNVHLIHSIYRRKQLKELSKRLDEPQKILVQINTGNDLAKGGIEPEELEEFLETAAEFPEVQVAGIMTIPPFDEPIETTQGHFRTMKSLAQGHPDWTVSMGMTSDFEAAIAEGATIIRVGTAIFGARNYQ